MTRLAWVAALVAVACGGFQNAPLEPVDAGPDAIADSPAPPDVHDPDVAPPCPTPVPLVVRIDYLPGVRVGEAYLAPLQLDAYPDVSLSWWVAEGSLPAGIVLDPASGLLHGRVQPGAEGLYALRFGVAPLGGDACVAPGESRPVRLAVFGACDGLGPACLPPLTCAGGHCLLAGADCPSGPGEGVALGVTEKGYGVHRYTDVRVLANTRDANPAASIRYGLLEIFDAIRKKPQSLTYHLPQDLLLPVGDDQVVTISTYFDDVGSSALSIADAAGGPLFFAYDGPLTGPPFMAVCRSVGGCPLLDLANLLSDCAAVPAGDGCTVAPATLRLAASASPAYAAAGETVPLGEAAADRVAHVGLARQLLELPPEGPPSPTLWHAFLVQRASACPSPLITLTSRGLDDGVIQLRLDGRLSRALGSTVTEWEWSFDEPEGNGGALVAETSGDDAVMLFEARTAGYYGFRLAVIDAEGQRSCTSDFVTWWRDGTPGE